MIKSRLSGIHNHGNGYATLYGHLRDLVAKDGDLIQRGDLIAHEGTTGNSTGPHLHFEVRKDGATWIPVRSWRIAEA